MDSPLHGIKKKWADKGEKKEGNAQTTQTQNETLTAHQSHRTWREQRVWNSN